MWLGLYQAATRLASPVARRHLRRRAARGKEDPARLEERLGRPSLPRPDGPLVWVHAASIGESLSLLPLIEALLRERPVSVLVTTGTVSSARLMAERLPARALHQFAPLDLPGALAAFLDHWRPDLALLVESELWPNLILNCRARGIPLALVNARMSERSYRRWRRLPGGARALLSSFAMVLAQSRADAERLRALGAREVGTPGNLKHAAAPLEADAGALDALRDQLRGRSVWVAASTHGDEEARLAEVHRRIAARVPGLLTIIVPRHPERGPEIAARLRADGFGLAQRSRGEAVTDAVEIYLADTLGELGLLYRLAEVAFIGGSLVPHGGQNPLEAARLGCPVLYGPNTWNFAEITARLEAAGAAERVAHETALAERLAALLADEPERAKRAQAALDAVAAEAEVLNATLEALAPLLDPVADART